MAVDIRVDLPAYSLSFTVSVPSQASVADVKHQIHATCPGRPRPDGQRLIWRGRILDDHEPILPLWPDSPRVLHLAVHPSAWSAHPPQISPTPSPTLSPPPNPTAPLHFVLHLHHTAYAALSTAFPPPPPLSDLQDAKSIAQGVLHAAGWAWPSVFDKDFPPSSPGGLLYELVSLDGKPYLRLLNPGATPTPLQEHALSVLTFTFTILTTPLLATPTVAEAPPEIAVPPHINQLLQQMGMPGMRVAGGNPPRLNNPIAPQVREINIRPLIAPLVLLAFRTLLLLYFVAPARKPIFGILILAWMLYEVWQPIRNALAEGANAVAREAADRRRDNPNPVGGARDVPLNNAPPPPPVNGIPPANGARRNPQTLDQQFSGLFESLANINIAEEQRTLNAAPGASQAEPSLGHKVVTFLSLLVTTLHPAVWNRRRTALRRREGTVRTEARIRNGPPSEENEGGSDRAAEMREELRAQFERRPRWIQRYMERVMAEEWVDDAD